MLTVIHNCTWRVREMVCWCERTCIFLFHPLGFVRSQIFEPLRAETGLTLALQTPTILAPDPCPQTHTAPHGLLLAWPSRDLSHLALQGPTVGQVGQPGNHLPTATTFCPSPGLSPSPALNSLCPLGALTEPAPQESEGGPKGCLFLICLKVP